MGKKLKSLAVITCILTAIPPLYSQGYIVPNGVVYSGYIPGAGYEIDVVHDPAIYFYTGFWLNPVGKTLPSVYTNTFQFAGIVDVGVRVFLVPPNQPISLQPILAQSYPELTYPNTYVFADGSPFYVGLYTGNQNFYPPNGIYSDPLFGWARLVNNQGVIEMLDSALAYQAQGIFAGTLNLVPEPSVFTLFTFGALLLGWRFLCKRP